MREGKRMSTSITRTRVGKIAAVAAAGGLILAGCGDETANNVDINGAGDANGAADGAEPGDSDLPDGLDGDGTTVTLGYIAGWTDGVSTAYLLENLLTQYGYEVELDTISDAPLLYQGLSDGYYDIYPSAWPEVTHAEYMETYGDGLTDWGTYYEGAVLTLAVPEYVDINSIEELNDNVDLFGGRIVGIEPGAGLTGVVENSVIPDYDLDYSLLTSSTVGMLAELQSAVNSEEPIVVTLWRPFWAYNEFPMKDLEDPQGALGDPEGLHFIANAEFAAANPDPGTFIESIQLTDEQFGDLEDLVVNEYGEGQEAEAVQAWLDANPDVIELP